MPSTTNTENEAQKLICIQTETTISTKQKIGRFGTKPLYT